MPYLPPVNVEQINSPIPLGKDFWFQVDKINEKWRKYFPLVPYYPILKSATPSTDVAHQLPTGGDLIDESEGTIADPSLTGSVFDPIYGEAVDPIVLDLGEWVQPHQSGNVRAFDVEQYAPPVDINLRVFVEKQDVDLHMYGFEKALDLVVSIPVSLLDEVNVQATAGDYFKWGGAEYEVVQVGPNNRFLNLSTYLFILLNCQNRRRGS